MTIDIRRVLSTLIVVAGILIGSQPAQGDQAGTAAAPEGERRAGLHFVGIELRPNGVGRCTPATPTPCSNFVYGWRCPEPGMFRLTNVRTYMAAADERVVGFELRARLIPRTGSAAGIPWVVDTERFTGRPTAITRLMGVSNVSRLVTLDRLWDLQVRARFDIRDRPDDIRLWQEVARVRCP